MKNDLGGTSVARDGLSGGGDLRDALEVALRSGAPEVRRLSYARASVTFRVHGQADTVLRLDRRPPEVGEASGPTDALIELTPELAAAFADGRVALPDAVRRGVARIEGDARSFLEVVPILRVLLARESGFDIDFGESVSPGAFLGQGSGGANPAATASDLLAIETQNLHKRFGAQRVLRGASVQVPAGMISCVLGPSGTGKSVLLKHLIGLMRPDAGDILIRGRRLSKMRDRDLVALRSEIGVMFQDGALFSTMSIYDNVAFPLRQHTDLEEDDIREVVEEKLDAVGLMKAADRLPAQLSGGMKKRAGLARALVLDPGIVLCDEPDSGLDPVRTALLADLLREQHARNGGTMLVITHNIALAERISDHLSMLWNGEVVASGSFDELSHCENPLVEQFLVGASSGPLGMD